MMIRKFIVVAALTGAIATASPALAGGWGGWGGWGKPGGSSTSGGSSGGTTTSSGGTTTSSGGHKVPEPGMLGILGASLLGLGYARRRAAKRR